MRRIGGFLLVVMAGTVGCSTIEKREVEPGIAPGEPGPVEVERKVERAMERVEEVEEMPRLDGWERVADGVDLLELTREKPRRMRCWAVRVRVAEGGLEWVVTGGNGEEEGETDGLRTSTFAEREGCLVAVNAAPFSPVHLWEGRAQEVAGLGVSDGVLVSPGGGRPALVFDREGKGRVVESVDGGGAGVWDGVGGFGVVLQDGDVVGGEGSIHPRTAAGVNRDGRVVFLLVIDGRQPGVSEGATTGDLGRLLKEMGAWDGINLDGGGRRHWCCERRVAGCGW